MKSFLLRLAGKIPILGPLTRRALRKVALVGFENSPLYWEERYQKGRTSGDGSYGKLATYKAGIVNAYIQKEGIRSVIEFGCGDGNQLALLQSPSYIGLDVSSRAISLCRRRFQDDLTKSFFTYSPAGFVDNGRIFYADLALSLDVIYHLVEDEIFEKYMSDLFNSAAKHVMIYSSNDAGVDDVAPHVKHRVFTHWIEKNCVDWSLSFRLPNPFPYNGTYPKEGTSFSDFYVYQRTPHA
jgi:SAM-dependent methyltransferase